MKGQRVTAVIRNEYPLLRLVPRVNRTSLGQGSRRDGIRMGVEERGLYPLKKELVKTKLATFNALDLVYRKDGGRNSETSSRGTKE